MESNSQFESETIVLMQQGYGGGASANSKAAKDRKAANAQNENDRITAANGGKVKSGFAGFSKTADTITAAAKAGKVAAAKGRLTKAQKTRDEGAIASAGAKLKEATASPVSAASLVNSKSKKSQAAKRTRSSRTKTATPA